MFVGRPEPTSVMYISDAPPQGKLIAFPQILDERAWNKYSSLLRAFMIYVRTKFYNIGPRGQSHKTFLE